MQRGRARSEFATRVFSKIVDSYVSQVDLGEGHGLAVQRRFRLCINIVDENTHPLLTCAVRIDSATNFSGGLYFNTFSASFDGVTGIDPLDDEIGMAVEVLIFPESS